MATGAPEQTRHGSRAGEVAAAIEQLRGWLADRELAAVALTGVGPVAWLTAGLVSAVERGNPASPVWAVVSADSAALVTTTVEHPRLEAEAGLPELGLALASAPWHEPGGLLRLAEQVAGAERADLAADGHPGFGHDADDDLAALRLRLPAGAQARLALLGADAARALEGALARWRPGERDLDLQARIAGALEREGIGAPCLIVGGDERVERFRHPLACGAPMHRLVMAVLVAERGGLHVALTRFACAGPLTASLAAARRTALAVEQAVLAACRPGAHYADALAALAAGYAAEGRPGSWSEHYQGGPIAYRQREFEVAPGATGLFPQLPVEVGHALAWNPSAAGGGKAEDTFLVANDGLRALTVGGDWPVLVEGPGRGRPAVLDVTTGTGAAGDGGLP